MNPQKIKASLNAGLKKYGPFYGLLAFCLIAVAVVYHKELRVFYVPPAKSPTIISDDYNDAGGTLTNIRKIEGKPIRTEYGMAVGPGQEWRITYDFEKDPDEDVWMQLSFYRPTAALRNRVEILSDGVVLGAQSDTYFLGDPPINLSQMLHGVSKFSLRLSAALDANALEPVSTLNKFNITISPPLVLPPASYLLAIVIAALMMFAWASTEARLSRFAPILGALYLMVLLVWRRSSLPMGGVASGLIILAPIGVLGYRLIRTKLWNERKDIFYACVLAGIVVAGCFSRWEQLEILKNSEMEPDAVTYMNLAMQMRQPFDTEFREPLFIWFVRALITLTYRSPLTLRLMTVILSLVVIALTYEVARRCWRSEWGVVAAAILAASPFLIMMSGRGLRTELYSIVLLGYLWVLFRKNQEKSWKNVVLHGVMAGLNNLMIVSSLTYTVPLLVIKGIVTRWKIKHIAVALGISFVILFPHLLNNRFNSRENEWMFSNNIHARFYRNQEFKGQPGFPSVTDVSHDSYTGPHITTAQYIFGLHTLNEVIRRVSLGYWLILFGRYTRGYMLGYEFVFVLYVIGFLLAFMYPAGRWILVSLFFMNGTMTFLVGMTQFPDLPRLLVQVAPLAAILAGLGVVEGARLIIGREMPEPIRKLITVAKARKAS